MKNIKKEKRVRGKIRGTEDRPRLSVFRSSQHIYAQIIDDEKGVTLVCASDKDLDSKKVKDLKKTEIAALVGDLIAERAVPKKIKKVRFDRGSYRYHGRVKILAESARKGGLIF